MSHEVERMFSVTETPWHGLGAILPSHPDIDKVRELAFPWEVEMKQLYIRDEVGLADAWLARRTGADYKSIKHHAAVRKDNGYVLGVHGPNWTPLQNGDLLEKFRPLYDQGKIVFETAGTLNKGKKVWVLAQIVGDPGEVVKGDPVFKYLLLANGHDGSLAATVGFTPIRVVCANTLAWAVENADGRLLRVIHTPLVSDTVSKLFETINVANQQFEAGMEIWQALAKRSIVETDFHAYVKLVFGKSRHRNKEEARVDEIRVENIWEQIQPLMEKGHGTDIPGVKGTYWGAYNAINQYLNYDVGRSQGTRLGSLWLGSGAKRNRIALDKAKELALA